MTDATTDPTQEDESTLLIGADPAAQMADVLDFLAPESDGGPEGEGAPADGTPPADAGQPAPAGEGAGAAGGDAQAPAVGDAGEPNVPGGRPSDPAPAGDAPPSGGGTTYELDATTLRDDWGKLTEGFETAQTDMLRQSALEEVRSEHEKYFEALNTHPRALVGRTVPSVTGSGDETLRDSRDAAEWQEAAKVLLVDEIDSRVERNRGELAGVFETVTASIELFRDNADLVPRTKQFDRDLADRFATFVKPYEVRNDGKLTGYSVPVQPIIDQLRSQLTKEREAAKAAPPAAQPPAPTPQQQRAAEQERTPQGQFSGPQAGISSKAGSESGGGDSDAQSVMSAFWRQNGLVI